jgi:hypothetical protein
MQTTEATLTSRFSSGFKSQPEIAIDFGIFLVLFGWRFTEIRIVTKYLRAYRDAYCGRSVSVLTSLSPSSAHIAE